MSKSRLQQIHFGVYTRITLQTRTQRNTNRHDPLGCTLRLRILSQRRSVFLHPMHRPIESDKSRNFQYLPRQVSVINGIVFTWNLGIDRYSRAVLYGSPLDDQKPVMVLMATRVPDIHYSSDEEKESPRSPECFSVRTEEEIFRKGDRIIVWLGSNVQTNLTYTVAVSTLDNEIR